MEKKLKEANQQAEKSNIELAQSKERYWLHCSRAALCRAQLGNICGPCAPRTHVRARRVTLVESKLRQLAELLKAEREANVKSASENQSIEIELLKKKLSEAAQKEVGLTHLSCATVVTAHKPPCACARVRYQQTLQAELTRVQQSSSQPSPQATNAQVSPLSSSRPLYLCLTHVRRGMAIVRMRSAR
jgi:hypothetical protein